MKRNLVPCDVCGSKSKVIRTDTDEVRGVIRRRRECESCKARFTVIDDAPQRQTGLDARPMSAAQAGRTIKRTTKGY